MNSTTEMIDQQIISLRKNGLMQREIAAELSVTRDKVRGVLNKEDMENYKYERLCLCCGNNYETIRHQSKFCSSRCRLKHYRSSNNKVISKCKNCKKEIKFYKEKAYCSEECLSEHYKKINPKQEYIPRPKHVKSCVNCNKEYDTHFITTSKYCSNECSYEYKVKQKQIHNIKCKECSRWFPSTNSRKIFCSIHCGNKFGNRKKETIRRKQLRKNGKINWDISIARLTKRDKGICYLCSEQVDSKTHPNHDDYPSIEHVVPVVKGGTHTWDNVKLAHRKCNYIKSDNLL